MSTGEITRDIQYDGNLYIIKTFIEDSFGMKQLMNVDYVNDIHAHTHFSPPPNPHSFAGARKHHPNGFSASTRPSAGASGPGIIAQPMKKRPVFSPAQSIPNPFYIPPQDQMAKQTIYVVAGNVNEFNEYVAERREFGLTETNRYVYVTRPDTLRGLKEIKGVFIGSYENRSDIEEIRNNIKFIKAKQEVIASTEQSDIETLKNIESNVEVQTLNPDSKLDPDLVDFMSQYITYLEIPTVVEKLGFGDYVDQKKEDKRILEKQKEQEEKRVQEAMNRLLELEEEIKFDKEAQKAILFDDFHQHIHKDTMDLINETEEELKGEKKLGNKIKNFFSWKKKEK